MAARRTSKKKGLAPRPSTQVANWEEQMKQDAQIASNMESRVAATQFFSTKGGVLKFNDTAIPGNEMAVIIADYITEKAWYEEDFDPENPQTPGCFAFTRGDGSDMEHHEDATNPQHDGPCCETRPGADDGCDWDKFGSAERGQGKACKDGRRLALLPAGRKEGTEWIINEDPEWYEAEELALLRIPPTSLKAWAKYVKQLAGALGRPPYGVITLIQMVPDPKNQFAFTFTALGNIPDAIGGVIMARHRQCQEPKVIDFPYMTMTGQDEDSGRGRGSRNARSSRRAPTKKAAKKKTAAKKRSRKY